MNERIKEFAKQAGFQSYITTHEEDVAMFEKFAELIVTEHLNLLRQEWYYLNNLPKVEDETPRDIGIRVGKKGEVIILMDKIKKHFETTPDTNPTVVKEVDVPK